MKGKLYRYETVIYMTDEDAKQLKDNESGVIETIRERVSEEVEATLLESLFPINHAEELPPSWTIDLIPYGWEDFDENSMTEVGEILIEQEEQKESCDGKVVEIEGKKYKLVEID